MSSIGVFGQSKRYLQAVRVFQSVASVLTIRPTSMVCSCATMAFLQRRRTHSGRPTALALAMVKELDEESLVRWILSLDHQRGAAPRPADIREMANILLPERGSPSPQTVGIDCLHNFIKRRDELKSRFSRRYNYQRVKCEDPKVVKEWFNRVQITIMQHGISYEDIYNFDETGYAMGLVATAEVVTRAETASRPHLIQPGNREWVTSIECTNSTGWALPPCITFKEKFRIQGWYENVCISQQQSQRVA